MIQNRTGTILLLSWRNCCPYECIQHFDKLNCKNVHYLYDANEKINSYESLKKTEKNKNDHSIYFTS